MKKSKIDFYNKILDFFEVETIIQQEAAEAAYYGRDAEEFEKAYSAFLIARNRLLKETLFIKRKLIKGDLRDEREG